MVAASRASLLEMVRNGDNVIINDGIFVQVRDAVMVVPASVLTEMLSEKGSSVTRCPVSLYHGGVGSSLVTAPHPCAGTQCQESDEVPGRRWLRRRS